MALACVDSWDKHLTGTGLWAAESVIKNKIAPMDHIHSLMVATYVHGGIIGFALFLYLTGASLVRGWQLLAAGGSPVFALLVYGLGALLFDGQSACSLVTHPRFENLIYWFPVIAIAAAWRNRTESQAGRHPSSSESR